MNGDWPELARRLLRISESFQPFNGIVYDL